MGCAKLLKFLKNHENFKQQIGTYPEFIGFIINMCRYIYGDITITGEKFRTKLMALTNKPCLAKIPEMSDTNKKSTKYEMFYMFGNDNIVMIDLYKKEIKKL